MEKSNIFDNTKYFIIDMDGTFYLGGNIIPGAPDFITRLRETGRDFYFFTNMWRSAARSSPKWASPSMSKGS